jgi:succinate dehydrogenase/fumarate reductase cytochrome b subunit
VRWLLDFVIALTRAWAATYTRGLPSGVRAERREEIDSDLWHHQCLTDLEREPVTGTAVAILGRAVFGIPSDILWRMEVGSAVTNDRRTSVNDTWIMRIGLAAISLPLAFLVMNGVAIAFFGAGDFNNSTEHVLWGLAFLVLPLTTLVGLWLCREQPRIGLGMVVFGALGSALVMFWMAFITVPVAIVVIAFAVFRAGYLPRSSSRGQPA